MAGHSKFKNIMHRKGAQDKKRSAMFSKLSREITVAAKMGTPDPDMNPRLRLAVNAAKAQSMPKDNIQRAIDKASKGDAENYEEVRYEGYGPGGVAIIVEALTDNRNRTATNVRTAFSKNGGNLGASGAVSHGFDRMGLITYPAKAGDAEKVFEAALEAGAEDVSSDEESHEIWTAQDMLHEVSKALEGTLGEAESAKLAWKPQTSVDVDEANAASLMKLVDTLEDDDDVQTVWGNYEVSDEVMEKLGLMIALVAKALLSGALIVAIAEIGRRAPTVAALVASLPLVSVLGMILLWHGRPDAENMAQHAQATFWYVLPSLPMFLVIPALLRHGIDFWLSLLAGCALTVALYGLMTLVGRRFGLPI